MDTSNLIIKIEKIAQQENNSIKSNISKYIIDNINVIDKITINQISKACYCSKSSVVKFCKSLGFKGLKELLINIYWESQILNSFKSANIEQTELNDEYYKNIIENISYIQKNNYQNYLLIAQEIKKTKYIFLFGKGPNTHVCEVFKNYLIKLNFNCSFSNDADVQKRIVKNTNKDSLCFFFTYSGLTEIVNKMVNQAKSNNAKVVLCTGNPNTKEFKKSDFFFLIKNNEEIFKEQRSSIISFNFIIMQILNALHNAV